MKTENWLAFISKIKWKNKSLFQYRLWPYFVTFKGAFQKARFNVHTTVRVSLKPPSLSVTRAPPQETSDLGQLGLVLPIFELYMNQNV